jgi:curved DNA-binding protein CbpA
MTTYQNSPVLKGGSLSSSRLPSSPTQTSDERRPAAVDADATEAVSTYTIAETIERIQHSMDPYEVLGFQSGARGLSADQVDVAFRRLALLVHPDRCRIEGAHRAFERVLSARQDITNEFRNPNSSQRTPAVVIPRYSVAVPRRSLATRFLRNVRNDVASLDTDDDPDIARAKLRGLEETLRPNPLHNLESQRDFFSDTVASVAVSSIASLGRAALSRGSNSIHRPGPRRDYRASSAFAFEAGGGDRSVLPGCRMGSLEPPSDLAAEPTATEDPYSPHPHHYDDQQQQGHTMDQSMEEGHDERASPPSSSPSSPSSSSRPEQQQQQSPQRARSAELEAILLRRSFSESLVEDCLSTRAPPNSICSIWGVSHRRGPTPIAETMQPETWIPPSHS